MTRWFVLPAVIAVSLVLQTSVLPVHISALFKPDLLLIVTVYLALRGTLESGVLVSWGAGLLKDAFSGLYLGLNAFCFMLIYMVIRHLSDRLYVESGTVFVVTVSTATLASASLNLLLLVMFTSPHGISYSIAASLFPHLLVNAFCASLITLAPGFDSVFDRR